MAAGHRLCWNRYLSFSVVRWSGRRHQSTESVRIGCSSGFWGDTAAAAPQLVKKGNLNFLVSDYLSEITMSLLTAAKRKSPDFGYTPDFIQSMSPLLKDISQQGIKVVTNAGGVNISACAAALEKVAKGQGIKLNIATVTGDDLMTQLDEVKALSPKSMDTGSALPSNIQSLNAYLGAFPIAQALDLGADVVITGRCVDSALVLAPLIHKYKWRSDQYDLLAAGSLAGHIVECGAQSTGGIFTDWDKVDGWSDIGFPIVECQSDGSFTVTKPPNTGGVVNFGTVAEQVVYEIGDPSAYVLPDVVCDFSHVSLREGKENEVIVTGTKGRPPGSSYKVSATYMDGYRCTAVCFSVGPRSHDKLLKTANSIIERTRAMFKQLNLGDYTDVNLQVFGSEGVYGINAGEAAQLSREGVMWLAVTHRDKKALELFSREIAPAGTGMAPGLTNIPGGRPKVHPVLRLFSFLHPKNDFKVQLQMGQQVQSYTPAASCANGTQGPVAMDTNQSEQITGDELKEFGGKCKLSDIAYLRSGDKGNSANIGVVARQEKYYPLIKRVLTSQAVQEYFSHLIDASDEQSVQRYELPGINGLNFVLLNSLGGGGVASLRVDPQGKGYGQMLADFPVV